MPENKDNICPKCQKVCTNGLTICQHCGANRLQEPQPKDLPELGENEIRIFIESGVVYKVLIGSTIPSDIKTTVVDYDTDEEPFIDADGDACSFGEVLNEIE